MDLVSIITPTYNHQQFISQCIESVLIQKYKHWEMIIVDDGSDDNTLSLIQRYSGLDPRIRYFTQLNKGPKRLHETYNLALKEAKGKWIAILEGDDYWLPNKLDIQLKSVTDATTISYARYIDLYCEKIIPGCTPPFSGNLSTIDFLPLLLGGKSFMIAVTVLYKKSALSEIGGFHQEGSPAAVDMATGLKLVSLPGQVTYIPEASGVWRHHEMQSTNLVGIELAKFNYELVLNFFENLSDEKKKSIKISRNDIVKARHSLIADAYFVTLRKCLRKREILGIKRFITGTWRYGKMKRKIQALFAVGGILFHYDFEVILRIVEWAYSKTNKWMNNH